MSKIPLKVMIVEDCDDDAELLVHALEKGGYEPKMALVQTAAKMRTLLEREAWDLVVSDYVIPGFGGLAALEVLREEDLDVPFIIVSGKIGEDVAVEALQAGANDYLLKDRLARLGPAVDRALKEAAQKKKRRLAEEALRESEERYRRLVESCPDAMFIVTDGLFGFANPAGVKLLGAQSPLDFLGKPFVELVEHTYRPIVEEHLLKAEQGRDGPLLEQKMTRLDGSPVLVEMIARGIQYHREPAIQVICRDISDRKEMEQQLSHVQKMEAIARLAGGVANDFNNLLTVITGYSGLIRSGLAPDHPLQKDLHQIVQSTERAIGLTNQLLAISRKEVSSPQPIDLNVVIDQILPLVRRLTGEKVRCELKTAPNLGAVRADRGQMETLIINLAAHARDNMPKGGLLLVETANVDVPGTAEKAGLSLRPGKYVSLVVTDTGRGLSDELRQHLFEPFFDGSEPGHNTGLGLATVYAIVRQHGGEIVCESEVGKGSVFRIYLPRQEKAALPPGGNRLPPPPAGNPVVLVVEDEEVLREFANLILRKNGFQVLTARDGMEALEILSDTPRGVNLVFTDVVMPRMGGAEVARRLQASHPHTPVLFTSGYPRSILAESGLDDPALDFLQKPYTTKALLEKIREVLSQSAGA